MKWYESRGAKIADSDFGGRAFLWVRRFADGSLLCPRNSGVGATLREYQEFYDPLRQNRNLREMVIIGHSMGGILSNMQIRDSGDSLERQILARPITETRSFTEEQKKVISEAVRYHADRDITRAIFVASPHRGCELASGWVGKVGHQLIHFRSPFDLVTDTTFDRNDDLTEFGSKLLRKPPKSIQKLASDSTVLTSVLRQPIGRGVVLHSIIGNHRGRDFLSESSDGVVPYWSAHLDSAVSEKVVEVGHTAITKHPEAIAEIRRKLYHHAGLGEVSE